MSYGSSNYCLQIEGVPNETQRYLDCVRFWIFYLNILLRILVQKPVAFWLLRNNKIKFDV